jgi:hypothetical protein
MDNKERARTLYEGGATIAEVARQLDISDYKAKKLKPVEDAAAAEVADADGADEGLVWPIALEVPAGNLDAMIEKIPAAEVHAAVMKLDGGDKAEILVLVLQARLEGLVVDPT